MPWLHAEVLKVGVQVVVRSNVIRQVVELSEMREMSHRTFQIFFTSRRKNCLIDELRR